MTYLSIHFHSHQRSSGTHVQGGSQQNFRTQVSLFRKSGNDNQTPLEPGGTVQLGEELFLRAHVNSGDGKFINPPKILLFNKKFLQRMESHQNLRCLPGTTITKWKCNKYSIDNHIKWLC